MYPRKILIDGKEYTAVNGFRSAPNEPINQYALSGGINNYVMKIGYYWMLHQHMQIPRKVNVVCELEYTV